MMWEWINIFFCGSFFVDAAYVVYHKEHFTITIGNGVRFFTVEEYQAFPLKFYIPIININSDVLTDIDDQRIPQLSFASLTSKLLFGVEDVEIWTDRAEEISLCVEFERDAA